MTDDDETTATGDDRCPLCNQRPVPLYATIAAWGTVAGILALFVILLTALANAVL